MINYFDQKRGVYGNMGSSFNFTIVKFHVCEVNF